jgi:hypothetical protein
MGGPVRTTLPVLLAVAAVLAVGAGDTSADRSAGATARAWAIKVIVPGQDGASTRVSAAPPDAVAFDGAFAYPTDGSIVNASSVTTSVSATSGSQARAGATSQLTSLSVFNGEITASQVTGETHAIASSSSATGDIGVSALTNLVIEGQTIAPSPNLRVPLGDWGNAIVLEQTGQRVDQPTPGYHNFVTALDIVLTADHGGLPAQSEIQIGYAEANAQASEAPPPPTAPSTTTTTPKPKGPKNGESDAGRLRLPGVRHRVVRRHVRCGAR